MKFENPDSWIGGHYGLELYLANPEPERIIEILNRIWDYPLIDGPYNSHDIPISDQEISRPESNPEEVSHLYGLAEIKPGKTTVAGTGHTFYEEFNEWEVFFYLPMSGFGEVFPETKGFPFRPNDWDFDQEWEHDLNKWLFGLAKFINPVAKFEFGVIGFETNFKKYLDEFRNREFRKIYDSLEFPDKEELVLLEPTRENSSSNEKELQKKKSIWHRLFWWKK